MVNGRTHSYVLICIVLVLFLMSLLQKVVFSSSLSLFIAMLKYFDVSKLLTLLYTIYNEWS